MAGRAEQFVAESIPLLELVLAGPFREYTLHNPTHARKVLHIAGHIIADYTLERLSALEAAVIIMSCYLHDMGMVLPEETRLQILASGELDSVYDEWPELREQLESARDRLVSPKSEVERQSTERRIHQIHEAALAAHLRPIHATKERYQDLLARIKRASGRSDLCSVNGVSFEEDLILICMSHNENAATLSKTINAYEDLFPRDRPIGGLVLNTQFCAAVLRIADILDFDSERTPKILFESLAIEHRSIPGADVSLREWNKQMAVHTIDLRSDEVVISADSTHPSIERVIRDFCPVVESEVRATMAVLARNRPEILDSYRLALPGTVRAQIRANGYVYKDLSFKLNESAIVTLLLGENLYSSPLAAVREAVQNAVDACLLRRHLQRDNSYVPQVTVQLANEGNVQWLAIEDNGIGMDDYVLSNYFFRVGNSYYRSAEFAREVGQSGHGFTPTSRFGIGILSVFMLTDVLEVETRRYMSPRGDAIARTLTVQGKDGMAFIVERAAGAYGTTLRLRLKDSLGFQNVGGAIAGYLRQVTVRPRVPVTIRFPGMAEETFRADSFITIREPKGSYRVEPFVLNLEDESDFMRGKVVLFLDRRPSKVAFLSASHFSAWDYQELFVGPLGNRLTVNGFSMAARKLSRAIGINLGGRVAAMVDIDVSSVPGLSFDVARSRLTRDAQELVRKRLRELTRRAIAGDEVLSGLLSKLGLGSSLSVTFEDEILVTDEELLAQVEKHVPKEGAWEPGLHRKIAQEIGGRPTLVHRALATLLAQGRVSRPDPKKPGALPNRGPEGV